MERAHSLLGRAAAQVVIATALTASLSSAPVGAAEAEAQRLGNAEFHEGLLKLKLLDLLDFDLTNNPPADELAGLLVRRRMSLAVWSDELTDAAQRRAALAKANDILEGIIREHGRDAQALRWRLTLAGSLIYEQAEPLYSSILYSSGTQTDRTELGALMVRARGILVELLAFLDAEYARLDELSVTEYERLEDTGYVVAIEEAMPRAEYMLRWAKFYTALSLEASSANRRGLLEGILHELTQQTSLLTLSHSVTHAQAQSLLLAGMTCRLLANYEPAIRFLQDAVHVTESVADPRQRRDLRWLVILASVERVRALRDDGRLDDAAKAARTLRRRMEDAGAGDFGHRLVLALLEGSIEQARAGSARRRRGDPPTEALTDRAVEPLIALAREQPAHRDEIYATLYRQIRTADTPERLHPFQQCALIAGHIAEANHLRLGDGALAEALDADQRRQAEARAVVLLDQAIALARGLVKRGDRLDGGLWCEALYNLAVAEHHRGRRLDSAQRFSAVAEQCPRFPRALSAATFAVEIAAQLTEDPTLRARQEVQELFVHAARTLVASFESSDAAEYWRFFLAQALEDTGDLDGAAREYARVAPKHPHFLTARFRAVKCQIDALSVRTAANANDKLDIRRRASRARRAAERFKKLAAESADNAGPRLVAESEVLLAEMNVLTGVDKPRETIALLRGFEERYAEHRDLIGRVLRARIIAFEATGQLNEARKAVPRYVASAPAEAGSTLQALFDATWEEIERFHKLERHDLARRKADAALLFAEQVYAWALARPEVSGRNGLYLLRLQLAESYLETDGVDKAHELFRQAVEEDAARQADEMAHDWRAVMGLARTLSRRGACAEALPLFNRMYHESPQGATRRFAALYGDLHCRTELREEPADIIDVIRQHRYLNPDMGGEALKKQFAELQRRNEQRLSNP